MRDEMPIPNHRRSLDEPRRGKKKIKFYEEVYVREDEEEEEYEVEWVILGLNSSVWWLIIFITVAIFITNGGWGNV